jgi:transcriptional regulator with XRE-family HTH domain
MRVNHDDEPLMTESFGRKLQRERELRQVTIESIAALTKIRASLFEELERDDTSRWPSGIFRRSFIKAYAQAIGVDVETTVREFLERFPDPAEAPAPELPESARRTVTVESAEPDKSSKPAHTRESTPAALRLTLVETGLPFSGGRLLADIRRRWSAAAWDLGSILAMALTSFVFVGSFWRPFGVVALGYYLGGILLLGNSPGVCLFAPRPADGGTNESRPSRVSRHRPAAEPVQIRATEGSPRPVRFRSRAGLPH